MATTKIDSDLIVNGNFAANGMTIPAGAVTDSCVAANAQISSSKLRPHKTVTVELFGPATSVASVTKWILMIKGATSALLDFQCAVAVAGSAGAGLTCTVDLQRSTTAGGFATVLSSTVDMKTTLARTATAGTITTPAGVAGDIYEVIVTAAAGSGTLPQGLTVSLRFDETYS